MLNAVKKKKLLELINRQYVDVTELPSYTRLSHDPGMDRFAEPDDEDWDVTEEYELMGAEAIKCIEYDGLWEHTHIDDKYTEEAIEFIRGRTYNGMF